MLDDGNKRNTEQDEQDVNTTSLETNSNKTKSGERLKIGDREFSLEEIMRAGDPTTTRRTMAVIEKGSADLEKDNISRQNLNPSEQKQPKKEQEQQKNTPFIDFIKAVANVLTAPIRIPINFIRTKIEEHNLPENKLERQIIRNNRQESNQRNSHSSSTAKSLRNQITANREQSSADVINKYDRMRSSFSSKGSISSSTTPPPISQERAKENSQNKGSGRESG